MKVIYSKEEFIKEYPYDKNKIEAQEYPKNKNGQTKLPGALVYLSAQSNSPNNPITLIEIVIKACIPT
jgi:hypothetical protein